ncbi:hypothetical protein Tco_1484033 [Tanacetum coccineum]
MRIWNGGMGVRMIKCVWFDDMGLRKPLKQGYVHNNIFFSFAIDADLKQFSKKQTLEANLNPSEKALAKSSTTINGDKFSFATAENGAAESAFDTPS